MTISLTDGATTVELHSDLYWSDEHNWHPVEQSTQRTITGALIVSTAARVGGQPITLEPEDDSSAWMPLSTVTALRNLAAAPGKQMTLTLRGETFEVMFRHQDGALEARPVVHYNDANNADFHLCVVRLMRI
jgi:hypothetical protein